MLRTHARDRAMLLSVTISVLFHLSMVTVFRIVIYFPSEPVRYYDLSIIKSSPSSSFASGLQQPLKIPSSDDVSERLFESGSDSRSWSSLPHVTLPTLQFSELELVRLSQTGLNTRTRYEELFKSEPDDLWSRFGQKLSNVGDLLNRSVFDQDRQKKTRRILAGRPAPGFESYLEWMSAPYDRQPLITQKIEALWGADSSVLLESVILIFRVNNSGRVTFVQMPIEDDAGIVESSAKALLRYRFEPLFDDAPEIQHGSLIIQAEGSRR